MRVRPAARGTNNWTWLVELPDRRVVVRLYQNLDETQVASEHALLGVLAATGLPFAVPRPLPTADGRTWVRTGHGPAAVFAWIDGERPEPTPAWLRAVGTALARLDLALAALPIDLAIRDWRVPLDRTHVDAGSLRELLDVLGVADELADDMQALDAAYADLLTRAPVQLVHQDMALSNVLVRAGRVVGLLDFELAGIDIRVSDLVALLHQTGCLEPAPDPLARAAAVLDGYGQVVRLDPVEVEALPGLLRFRAAGALVWKYGRYRAGLATLDDVRTYLSDLREALAWVRRHGSELATLARARVGYCADDY